MANIPSQSDTSEPEAGSEQESAGLADRIAKTTNDATSETVERLQHVRERFDQRLMEERSSIAQRVRDVSRVLDGGGKMLGDDEFGARCLHYASEQLDRVASYVEQVEPRTITDDLRSVARDRPAWFFGSAFTLGLALGRFAHSTAASVAGASTSGAAVHASMRPRGPTSGQP